MSERTEPTEPRHASPLTRWPATRLSGIRPDIEGMRALAILLVVAYHARVPGFGGGFIGVDVFFVLSGYLITGLLIREVEGTGGVDLLRFYVRRARRLLPAAALVLLATLIVGRLVLSPLEMKRLGATGFATSFYASNLYFIRQATDYQAVSSYGNPLLHTWSLAVEEQFYLVWPLLIMAGAALVRRTRRGGALSLFLGFIGVASFAACLWLTGRIQPWAFFGSPLRAWEFAAGGLAVLVPHSVGITSRARLAGGWAALAVTCAAALWIGHSTPFPGTAALAPVAATALLLACGAPAPGTGAGRLLGLAPLQRIGKLSYSWYLWHWPMLVYATHLGFADTTLARVLVMLGSLGLAELTFRFVEDPVRRHRALTPRPALTLGLAGCLTLLLGGTSILTRFDAVRVLATPEQIAFAAAQDVDLAPPGCRLGYLAVNDRACEFGDTASAATVVIFGDSHAEQWVPALSGVARDRGWRVRLVSKGDCPAVLVDVWSPVLNRAYTECSLWRRNALERIVESRPAMILIANSNLYALRPESYNVTPEAWQNGLRGTLAALKPSGAQLVLLRDTPRPGFHVPECLSRAAYHPVRRETGCEIVREAAVDTLIHSLEREAAASDSILLIDLTDAFCDDVTCGTIVDGRVVYRDSNHMAAEFSASLADRLAGVLGEFQETTSARTLESHSDRDSHSRDR